MKTDNELIAGFHGWRHNQTPKNKGKGLWYFPEIGKAAFNSDNFAYHTSWDWLMPVVEKIENTGYEIDIFKKSCEISNSDRGQTSFFVRKDEASKINSTYQSIVEFIKWHNQQTP